MKKIIVYITLAILVAACAPSSRHSGEVTGVGGTAWNEPTPYGMVLISRGSYKMGPAEKDSIWGTQHCLLYTSPSPRDPKTSRMPSSA